MEGMRLSRRVGLRAPLPQRFVVFVLFVTVGASSSSDIADGVDVVRAAAAANRAAPCAKTCNSSTTPNFFEVEYAAASTNVSGARAVPNHMVTCVLRAPARAYSSQANGGCSVDVLELIEPYISSSGGGGDDDSDVVINVSLDNSGYRVASESTEATFKATTDSLMAAPPSSFPGPQEQPPPPPQPPEIQFAVGRPPRKNVIMLFTLISLSYSWREIDRLASQVNLVVLKLVDCSPIDGPSSGAGERTLDHLRSIMTLALTVSAGSSSQQPPPLGSWLPPPESVVFPDMAELHVLCAAAAVDLDGRRGAAKNSNILQNVLTAATTCENAIDAVALERQMPQLQALELSNFTNVPALPRFPWFSERLRLPRNLSRTRFFHSHYTNRNALKLDRNVYRRMLAVRGSRQLSPTAACLLVGTNVDRVDLDHNALETVGHDCFAAAGSSLQQLRLNDNRLTVLQPRAFVSLTNLTRLYLQNNCIERLEAGAFDGLAALEYLNLAGNRLSAIEAGAFSTLTRLRHLSLRDNWITSIATDAFATGATELSYLLLGRNRLVAVPEVVFRLRNALALELSDNEITFDRLASTLDRFDVDSARVYSVESISELDEMGQLSAQNTRIKIDLRRNRVRSLPRDPLSPAGLRSLEFISRWFELDLEQNPLLCDCHAWRFRLYLLQISAPAAGFESWKCGEPAAARGPSLLSAPGVAFSCAEPMAGCPAPCECRRRSVDNATIVDCSNRSMTAVPPTLPEPLSLGGEVVVDLRNNRIEALPASAAAGGSLASVTSLLLSGNALSSIEMNAIGAMQRLHELTLDNNRLTELPADVRNAELDALTLRSNYWPCDCRNDWMKAWLQRQRSVVSDLYQVTCVSTRDSVRGMPVVEVNDNDFVCIDEQYELKIAVGVTVSLLVLTLVCVALAYRYFSAIKIILYVKFYWHPFDRIDDDEESDEEAAAGGAAQRYDVFISYSSHDSDWVLGTLCRVLETRVVPPLRTCVHDKDFTVGCSIHDNILESVRLSRRMIVVLSEHFVRSEWCMLEFRTAHEKVMKERGAYLVVIVLDDIDVTSLDESLRAYLSTKTYLHVGNRWFWNKLLYVMPQRTHPRLHPDLPTPASRPATAAAAPNDIDEAADSHRLVRV